MRLRAQEDRREHRVNLRLAGTATRSDGSVVPVTIENLSKDGFRLLAKTKFAVGEEIYLKLVRPTNYRAEVRWAQDGRAGGILLDPIPTWR